MEFFPCARHYPNVTSSESHLSQVWKQRLTLRNLPQVLPVVTVKW